MLKQFMSGELGLKDTFWKFGIFGLLLFVFIVRLFEHLLTVRTMGVGLLRYYTHYFTPINPDGMAILWTLCYLSGIALFFGFCIVLLKSIWKSAAAYQKSPLLAGLAKLITLSLIAVSGIGQ